MSRTAGPDGQTVLSRLLSLMVPEAALLWLEGSNPFFGGARPIYVLAINGPGPVLGALAVLNRGDSPRAIGRHARSVNRDECRCPTVAPRGPSIYRMAPRGRSAAKTNRPLG